VPQKKTTAKGENWDQQVANSVASCFSGEGDVSQKKEWVQRKEKSWKQALGVSGWQNVVEIACKGA